MGATRTRYLLALPDRVAAAFRTIGGQSSAFPGARLGCLAVTTAAGFSESIMWMQSGHTQRVAVRCYALARTTSTYLTLLPSTHYPAPSLADRPAPSHTRCGTQAWCGRVCPCCPRRRIPQRVPALLRGRAPPDSQLAALPDACDDILPGGPCGLGRRSLQHLRRSTSQPSADAYSPSTCTVRSCAGGSSSWDTTSHTSRPL